MMVTNVAESNVPPYHAGSSYQSGALGNEDFVREYPHAAAFVVRLSRDGLMVVGTWAAVANVVTFTGISWAVGAYLVWRCFGTRRLRRVLTILLAVFAVLTLPYIRPALLVWFD
jgi:hypothetical protein